MYLKVIKEVIYGYNNILEIGAIVRLLKEYEYYYLIKTEDNIKINIVKDKAVFV